MTSCGSRSSVDCDQYTKISRSALEYATRPPGVVGAVTSLVLTDSVVTVSGALGGDTFPPSSRAVTVNVYVVFGDRYLNSLEVALSSWRMRTPSRKTE